MGRGTSLGGTTRRAGGAVDAALGQGCGGVCGWDGRRTVPRVAVGDFGRAVGAFWDGCMARPYVLVAGVGCGGHQEVFCAGRALGAGSGTGLVHGGRKGGERLGARGGHGGASGDGTGAGGGRLALRPGRDSPHHSPRRGHAHGGGWRAVAFGTTPPGAGRALDVCVAQPNHHRALSRHGPCRKPCARGLPDFRRQRRGPKQGTVCLRPAFSRPAMVGQQELAGGRGGLGRARRRRLVASHGWRRGEGRGGRPSRPHVGHCGRA